MQDFDVAVVGAGPVGCVAALAHARRGAKVALIEAQPTRRNRFAGELLHPPAVAALREVGITSVTPANDHLANRGFAVFSADRPTPDLLAHAGEPGFTAEFNHLVEFMQENAQAHAGVTWMPHVRVTEARDGLVQAVDRSDHTLTLRAPRIIAADGRFSQLRKSLGIPDDRTPLSNMAGLVLRGVELPFEGHGHVMLGGWGPILAYRIAEDLVRVCIDVPLAIKRTGDRGRRIWEAIRDQLPESLREPIRAELEADRVAWALIELRPRIHYHRHGVALVSDAIGHFHPMTGIGMTLGFGDAVELARHDNLDAWQKVRHRETLAPALLATALYEIFAVDAEPTLACREAIYQMWASRPDLRSKSMALLCCEDSSFAHLLGLGVGMVGRASVAITRRHVGDGSLREGTDALARVGGLIRWLLAESVPASMRILPAPPTTPFEKLRQRAFAPAP